MQWIEPPLVRHGQYIDPLLNHGEEDGIWEPPQYCAAKSIGYDWKVVGILRHAIKRYLKICAET
jgi:hypothetical protein